MIPAALLALALASATPQARAPLQTVREHLDRCEVEQALPHLRAELARLDAEGSRPDPDTWTELGAQLERCDAEDAARRLWLDVLARTDERDGFPVAALRLADQRARAGDVEGALVVYRELQRTWPGHALPAQRLARLLDHVGRTEEAAAVLRAKQEVAWTVDTCAELMEQLERLGRHAEVAELGGLPAQRSRAGSCMRPPPARDRAIRAHVRALVVLGRTDEAQRTARTLSDRSFASAITRLAAGVESGTAAVAEGAREVARLRDDGDSAGLWNVLADRDRPREVRLGALDALATLPGARAFARDELLGPQPRLARLLLARLGGAEVVALLADGLDRAPTGERPAHLALLAFEGSPEAHAVLRRWTKDGVSGADARLVLRAFPPYLRAEPMLCLVEGTR